MQFLKSIISCGVCTRPSALKFETAQVAPEPQKLATDEHKENGTTTNNPQIVAEMPAENGNENKENEVVAKGNAEESDQPQQPVSGCKCNPGRKNTGILYATPSDASKAPHEKYIFLTCPNVAEPRGPDAVMTVDVDPTSKTYCQVLCKLEFPNIGDEIHHTGWNACASCFGKPGVRRTNLIVPCLHSSRVYVVNTEKPTKLSLTHTVEANEFAHLNVSFLHTTHCLADGHIMISVLGDEKGDNIGEFVLLDAKDFRVVGKWNAEGHKTDFNYDYWYQPRKNVMLSTEWGSPNAIKSGFNPAHVGDGLYGNKVHVWDWTTRKIKQSLTLEGPTGWIPLEVRFYHEPSQPHAFVGTALGSAVVHLYQENDDEPYQQRVACAVEPRRVEGWVLPEMPALITDIILSMDDRFLYASCWLHGEIRQYNITDPFDVKLTGVVTLGGSLHNQSGIKVLDENFKPFDQTKIKGQTIYGGPQMMQLSLDGKRLYVTTSLYTIWDEQFYPDLMHKGSTMLMLDVDTNNGGISLNQDFLIDFGKLEGGPYAAHEMRYPGGDCTSDIWI